MHDSVEVITSTSNHARYDARILLGVLSTCDILREQKLLQTFLKEEDADVHGTD